MAQLASTGGPLPSGKVLTVADLLSRNTPVPVLGTRTARPVSVGSLLRREGVTPPVAQEPAPFRGSEPGVAAEPGARGVGARGVMVRRTAIAAGTLLAAGSVFGVVQVTDASLGGQDAASPYAGPNWLDGTAVPAPGVIVAPTASDTVDAGTPAPTSWLPVAFPGAVAGGTGGAAAANNAGAPNTGHAGGGGTSDDAGGGGTPSTGGPSGGGTSEGANSPGSNNPSPNNPGPNNRGTGGSGRPGVGGVLGSGSEAVGGTVSKVGSSTPLTGTTDAAGGAVSGGGSTVGSTADKVTAPAGGAVQGVTGTGGALGAVGNTAASLLGN